MFQNNNNDSDDNPSRIPSQPSWDDITYELFVRGKVEDALKAVELGKTVAHKKIIKRLNNEN